MSAFTPDFIPPHLAGDLSQFRKSPDGSVSFVDQDPQRANGLGPGLGRTTLSPEAAAATFDRDYRLQHSGDVADGAGYGSKQRFGSDLQGTADLAARWVGDRMRGASSTASGSVAAAGLLAALAGGALGVKTADPESYQSPMTRGVLYALLGGGLGALGLRYLQSSGQRKSASSGSDEQARILAALALDPNLSAQQKAAMVPALNSLSRSEQIELSGVIRQMGGAAVGLLIARFLGMKGLLPMAVAGMLGAAIASPSPHRNALGQIKL